MAQECGFFNAQMKGEEFDRVYLAEQFAAYFAAFIGNGIYGHSMQKLQVLCQDVPNMSIKVLSGEAYINGWWYRNTDTYNISVPIADGVLSRIDVVVVRWGNTERDMWLQLIIGVPSLNPVKPNIRRDADYYDLQLATIEVSAGSTRITQSNIKDTRLDNSVCGLVTGVVDQIDTTNLYNQFESYFEEFKKRSESDYEQWYDTNANEFKEWFDGIKGQLEEDAATSLQMQVNEHEERLSRMENMLLTGILEAPVVTSNNDLIATSGGDILVANWPIVSYDTFSDVNLIIDGYKNVTSSMYGLVNFALTEIPKVGETLTILLKGTLGSDRKEFQLYMGNNKVQAVLSYAGEGYYSATFKWKEYTETGNLKIYQIPGNAKSASTIEWVKLVRGTKTSKTYAAGAPNRYASSEMGGRHWYRIAEFNILGGPNISSSTCNVVIGRIYGSNNNEIHSVRIDSTFQSFKISSIFSKSNTQLFKRFRVVYNRTLKKNYIDVYCDSNTENTNSTYVIVNGVVPERGCWVAVTPEIVNDNISDETLLVSLDVSANS